MIGTDEEISADLYYDGIVWDYDLFINTSCITDKPNYYFPLPIIRFAFMGQTGPGAQSSEGQHLIPQAVTQVINFSWDLQ